MSVLVILGHQRPGSFNHTIADVVVEELRSLGHEVVFHDLYAEKFDPILPHEEIKCAEDLAPVIQRHCSEAIAADGFVVIHPNWWGMPPAVLKGWIDRVFRQGTIYGFSAAGVTSKLAGKRALVLTTSNTPREDELRLYGDPLENLWKNCIFGLLGVTDFARRNFESIIMSTPEQRAEWLDQTRQLVRERFAR
ncbi:MAG: NAD(P)H-dependent oxidoreductase [Patescibacteria group bacterium]|nr:NAD(P)H-dependent oxidoreductase [Patescibacteria group bacterium]